MSSSKVIEQEKFGISSSTEHEAVTIDLYAAGPSDAELPPPLYTPQPQDPIEELQKLKLSLQNVSPDIPLPLLTYSTDVDPFGPPSTHIAANLQQEIITSFFTAIFTKNTALVSAFLSSGIVSAETTDRHGSTPLLAATCTENVALVKLLLDAGADVNRFSAIPPFPSPSKYPTSYLAWKTNFREKYPPLRTPLMHACSLGSLPLTRLLLSEYAADDALVAPDGETALHLAGKHRQRDIVAYLPMRRAGGWRRWKCKVDRTVLSRAKKLGSWIWIAGRVLFWEIPKLLLWDCPKRVIVPKLKRLWRKRKDVPELIMKMLKGVWEGLMNVPKVSKFLLRGAWNGLKEVPKATWEAAKVVAKVTKWFVKLIWNAMKSLPGAVKIALVWIWTGVKAAGVGAWEIVKRLGSFLHTAVSAVVRFFRGITLQDIWSGFIDLLDAVFVKFPSNLWGWLKNFGKTTYEILGTLFGCTGKAIWYLLLAIIYLITYIPIKLFEILVECGKSVGNGLQEILLWINPKQTTFV